MWPQSCACTAENPSLHSVKYRQEQLRELSEKVQKSSMWPQSCACTAENPSLYSVKYRQEQLREVSEKVQKSCSIPYGTQNTH